MNIPQAEVLGNGMRVVLVPCEAESIAFGMFIASGSRHESSDTAGISHLIEHMLFKGTPARSPLEITLAIEGRGGNFNAYTSEEATCYYAHMPCEYMDEAVDIIADMYLHALVPADEFAREKQVVLEEIKMYADEPDSVAMENLQRALFPVNQLGAPVAGGAASLLPMRPIDLKRYIRTHYRPDNTVAVIAGKFDYEAAMKSIDGRLGKFRRKAVNGLPHEVLMGRVKPEVEARREIQQTQLALGYRTFGIADRRKYAATVFDAIMGRGMSSRLFQEVREKRGLSYDISSRMQFFQDVGMFTITAGMDPAKARQTLETIDGELRKICDRKVTQAELDRTKEFLIGNFRLSHEKVTSKLFFYGQTMLAFNRLVSPEEQIEGIRKVGVADVQNVAKEILKTKNRSISWVRPK
ncbi:MAG: insulinase family protein [Bacteroidales bacterium]|nr:insulinase family protein [Bacteroidales bacterium]